MRKRLVSYITVLSLIVSLVPAFTLPAFAADAAFNGWDFPDTRLTENTEPVSIPEVEYSLDNGETWKPCDLLVNVFWETGFSSCANSIVRLNRDITFDSSSYITLVKDNHTVTVDGRGHTINRGTHNAQMFTVRTMRKCLR